MIIYADGIFDIFHVGHVRHFKTLKNISDDVFLIIGVISDHSASSYKRKPIYEENHRYELVESCKYVDCVIKSAPLYITEDFLKKNKIDFVYHAFCNSNDSDKQNELFAIPMKLGIMRTILYNTGISTTDIINKIRNQNI